MSTPAEIHLKAARQIRTIICRKPGFPILSEDEIAKALAEIFPVPSVEAVRLNWILQHGYVLTYGTHTSGSGRLNLSAGLVEDVLAKIDAEVARHVAQKD